MDNIQLKLKTLPISPGVYIFRGADKKIMYIGKAASLKDRVRSYFQGRNDYARPIDFVIELIADIEIKQTETVLEAYLLEQELIKKHQPKYNVLGKDDKSFVYVCVTKEDFPRFEIKRKTDIEDLVEKKTKEEAYLRIYGPYTSKYMIEEALKILRKIFPYHNRVQKTEKGCLDFHIGLCPGPYAGVINVRNYRKNIRSIEMILKGKKLQLLSKLEKQMLQASQNLEYEKAGALRNVIFSLRHIQDIALLKNRNEKKNQLKVADGNGLKINYSKRFRIEGYDISNISGTGTVASMVVFDNREGAFYPNKKQYRKFRIKTVRGANDVASMQEVLRRRLKRTWPLPDLILLDGGQGHLNAIRKVLSEQKLHIPLIAVAKGPKRDRTDIYSFGENFVISKELLSQIRDEAHRFAIAYHRKLRGKKFLNENAK
jgi:excinuclease ABC subunit C